MFPEKRSPTQKGLGGNCKKWRIENDELSVSDTQVSHKLGCEARNKVARARAPCPVFLHYLQEKILNTAVKTA